LKIFCFRKNVTIISDIVCRGCFFRKRCRSFQLWLQPELPFIFKSQGRKDSIFDSQNKISDTLDSLFPAEYNLLRNRALRALPGVEDKNSALIRIKMYELLNVDHT